MSTKSSSGMSLKVLIPNTPRLRALADGSVQIPGLNLEVNASINVVGQRFSRMLANQFDAGEMCMLTYIRAREEGWPYIALPVFVVRGLKHRHVVVRRDSAVRQPRDLIGKTVGLTRYVTSPVWTRALLQHEYDVPLESIKWVAADPELWPISIPEFKTERLLEERTTLLRMVAERRMDAAIFPGNDGYNCFYGGGGLDKGLQPFPELKTLIDDPQVVIDYYRRKQIYPIIHTVVVKESLLRQHPDLARQLTFAFQQSKELAGNYLDAEGKRQAAEEIRIIGRDPYDCTLSDQDFRAMDIFLDHVVEQKLLRLKPTVASLFALSSV